MGACSEDHRGIRNHAFLNAASRGVDAGGWVRSPCSAAGPPSTFGVRLAVGRSPAECTNDVPRQREAAGNSREQRRPRCAGRAASRTQAGSPHNRRSQVQSPPASRNLSDRVGSGAPPRGALLSPAGRVDRGSAIVAVEHGTRDRCRCRLLLDQVLRRRAPGPRGSVVRGEDLVDFVDVNVVDRPSPTSARRTQPRGAKRD